MIVLDDQDHSKKGFSESLDNLDRGAILLTPTSTTFCLPDYDTSQASSDKPQSKPEPRKPLFSLQRTDRKFWRAVLFAFIIYIIISLIVGLPFLIIAIQRHGNSTEKPLQTWATEDLPSTPGSVDFVELESLDELGTDCNMWQTWDTPVNDSLFAAAILYAVPINGSISLQSNYSRENSSARATFGSLTVDLNPNTTETNSILSLTMQYSDPLIREATNICITKEEGEVTLTIYIPAQIDESHTLTFNINLLLPHSPTCLHVPALVTYLPLIEQRFGNLVSDFYFEKFDIGGFSSRVTVGSLRGGSVSVTISTAEINGTFEVYEALILETLAAPINANITLVNNLERNSPTSMQISTGNSYIDANVILVLPSTTADPTFFGSVRTFNGPLNLILSHASSSPPAIYGLRALNEMGSTNITVDSKFQGSFDVQTKFASVLVDKGTDSNSSDNPYGEAVARKYDYELETPSRVIGWVGWQPRQSSGRWVSDWRDRLTSEGFLLLESSLSPVHLQLSLKI